MLQREFLKPLGGGGAGSRRAPHPVRRAGRGGIADPSVPRSPLSRPPPASPFSPPEPSRCRTECPRSSPGPNIIDQAKLRRSQNNFHAKSARFGPGSWRAVTPAGVGAPPASAAELAGPRRAQQDPRGWPCAGAAQGLGAGASSAPHTAARPDPRVHGRPRAPQVCSATACASVSAVGKPRPRPRPALCPFLTDRGGGRGRGAWDPWGHNHCASPPG